MRLPVFFIIILLCAGVVQTSHAEPPPHAKERGNQKMHKVEKQEDRQSRSEGRYKHQDADRDLLRATITALAARDIALGGGWSGYQPLPPGIAKNLARGKPLPPGIAKKAVPGGMAHKLPSYPGYEWYALGRDLVLINLASMVIADVLHDVFD